MFKIFLKAFAVPLLLILIAAELFLHFLMFLSFLILKPTGVLWTGILVFGGLFGGMIGMSGWEILGLFIFGYVLWMIPDIITMIFGGISTFRQNIWFFIKTREPY